MWKLSMKWVPKCLNVDQKLQQCQSSEQLLVFYGLDPNDFLSRLVTMDKTWLYHYDPEAKQQSMEWWHSGSPRPKKFGGQKLLVRFSHPFFGIKMASSSLIVFQRAKLSMQSITHLCCCNWRTFWRKRSPFFVQRGGHCCCRDLVGWRAFWIFFFLSGLQKLEQWAKKCIELRGDYLE